MAPFQDEILEYFMAVMLMVLIHTCISPSLPELVHDEDLTVGFIRLNNLPAMFAVEINNGQEYVLCFNGKSTTSESKFYQSICYDLSILYSHDSLCTVVGVYVNNQGQRSRKQELIWHSPPSNFGEFS